MLRIIDTLLNSSEPSIRYKTLVNVLGESPSSKKIKSLREEIKNSPRAKALLSRYKNGKIQGARHLYEKWQGSHWIFASLADLCYPNADKFFIPMRDEVYDYWLNRGFYNEYETNRKTKVYGKSGVPLIAGRYRRCGSQQGNALYSSIKLGLTDDRVHDLAERLIYWQWPDGGWNCDREPSADTSSFMETLIPMKGLYFYGKTFKKPKAVSAAKKAAEVFLTRKLFKRVTNNEVIHPEFTFLHHPLYWHYDILGGLKAMTEMNHIKDRRCGEALDLLESKRLKDGGFPSEKKYYKLGKSISRNTDYVEWGPTGKTKMNEWTTVDALYVLRSAGRFKV